MLDITVLIEDVDAARLSDKATENVTSNYSLNVSLAERERTSDHLVLSYSLELTSQPQMARFKVSGSATLKGTRDEIKEGITASDDNKPPAVLLTIYERIYSTLYVLAGALRVPHPMPNLLRKSS
ncbi:MAG TPA: hypothetical protein VEH01_03455 [Nitrososphaerales archaeon]|nr:hypothetical protein [Nitrososphaerales archaeon]